MQHLAENFKQKRLALNLTQEGLASKSGVSLGSLKRFENSSQISLESLLKLSVVLGCLDDFMNITKTKENSFSSLDELLQTKEKPLKKRGKLK
ncbi:helix-turn-helix transcriptional regulator [Sulfurimonas sp.]|uniref:helix-turn-helix domain-containing protein n=1 Tax=Sulfurimonas sp. TaxID=2022749 RepID=UPI0025EA760D|nr:helix-turn-helix transcriptional regulator [Sulfurimonas sp.]